MSELVVKPIPVHSLKSIQCPSISLINKGQRMTSINSAFKKVNNTKKMKLEISKLTMKTERKHKKECCSICLKEYNDTITKYTQITEHNKQQFEEVFQKPIESLCKYCY